jgi:RNA polymerase sigma-70 factor (ECF subfamily)
LPSFSAIWPVRQTSFCLWEKLRAALAGIRFLMFSTQPVSNNTNESVRDEKRLVSSLKAGQEDAFRILIRQYRGKLFSIAYGITLDREESLDIVQDVFLKVYRSIHKFREESKLSTWLYRITVNACLNWQRRWKRRFRWHHHPLDRDEAGERTDLKTEEDHPARLYERKELESRIWDNLKTLPEEARAVFVLREFEGLSYDEIAETLNIKKGTVSSRLFYVRKKLREALKEDLEGWSTHDHEAGHL